MKFNMVSCVKFLIDDRGVRFLAIQVRSLLSGNLGRTWVSYVLMITEMAEAQCCSQQPQLDISSDQEKYDPDNIA